MLISLFTLLGINQNVRALHYVLCQPKIIWEPNMVNQNSRPIRSENKCQQQRCAVRVDQKVNEYQWEQASRGLWRKAPQSVKGLFCYIPSHSFLSSWDVITSNKSHKIHTIGLNQALIRSCVSCFPICVLGSNNARVGVKGSFKWQNQHFNSQGCKPSVMLQFSSIQT